MALGKKVVTTWLSLTILTASAHASKSVFIISKHASPSEAQAYKIESDQVEYQADVDISAYNQGLGGVGVAVWPEEELMFITYEGSATVVWASTKTLQRVGEFDTTVDNCAGIVVDRDKGLIYIIDRHTEDLYVYSFHEENNTLLLEDTHKLEASSGYIDGWGLALDAENELLYVSTSTNTVHVYDTNNWSYEYPIDINVNGTDRDAVGIAVDEVRGYLYTGDWVKHNYLVRTSTSSPYTSIGVEITKAGSSPQSLIGVDVDEETGLVYCTTYHNDFRVYDCNLVLKDTEANNVNGPAGVAVGGCYKAPYFILVKDNNDPNNECVRPWNSVHENYLVYDICYDANGHADTNVVITDYLAVRDDGHPLVSYYPSDPCATYDPNEHSVRWDIGELGANDSNCIKLTAKVTGWATSRYTIKNVVAMEGDNYYNEATKDIKVCVGTGEIIYVDKDGNDANGLNDGRTWDDAYTVLEDAFAAACNDFNVGAIWVAGGTYKPIWDAENMTGYETFEVIEGVAVFGHFGGIGTYETSTSQRNLADTNNETILDGQIGEYYYEAVCDVVYANDVDDAIVDGFTIQNSYMGSGILLDSANISIINCKLKNNGHQGIECRDHSQPTIENCIFIDNWDYGVYSYGSSWPRISNCIFDGCDVTYHGLYSRDSDTSVADSIFKQHIHNAIKAQGAELVVSNCDFEGNGDCGIYASDSNVSLEHSLIANSGDSGLHAKQGSVLTLENSVISDNTNSGIYCESPSKLVIKNNWIHHNNQHGIFSDQATSPPLIHNNTIVDNGNYGINRALGADPNISNCIIWGNADGQLQNCSASYSCIENGGTSNGNINSNPLFYNDPNDPNNYHLSSASPCIDAGDPNFNDPNERDIDGEKRVADGDANGTIIVDMGADEYYWSPADFDANEIVNFLDYAMFADNWLKTDEDEDYNDIYDLADNNSIDFNDLDLFCEDWLWEAGWKKSFAAGLGGGFGRGMGGMGMELQEAAAALYGLEAVMAAETEPPQIEPADVEEITEWLEELWLTDEDLRELTSEDEWQEFIEAIEESAT